MVAPEEMLLPGCFVVAAAAAAAEGESEFAVALLEGLLILRLAGW